MTLRVVLLTVVFGLVAIAFAVYGNRAVCDESEQEGDPVALDVRIQQLIGQLGDEDPKVREKATSELGKIGKPALNALREATKSADAEIAWRAEQLVSAIESGRTIATEGVDAKEEGDAGTAIIRTPGGRVQVFVKSHSVHPGGSESIERTQTGDGKVTVVIRRKDKDGQEHVETYTADSPEEFARKFPEIDRKSGSAGITIRFGTVPEVPDDLDDWQKEQRRQLDEMLKRFSDRILEGIWDEDRSEMEKRFEQRRRRIEDMLKGLFPGEETEDGEESIFDRIERLLRESQRRLDELMERTLPRDEEAEDLMVPPWRRRERQDGDADRKVTPDEPWGGTDEPTRETPVEWNLGAEVGLVDEALRRQLDLPDDVGVIVHSVAKDSGADKAGFRQYDIVLNVNGEKVQNKWDFRRMVLDGLKKGDVVVDIIRRGEHMTLRIPRTIGLPVEKK